ncbi:MAG: alpha/beta fold hydrolase [Pseudomonadota bacterium]
MTVQLAHLEHAADGPEAAPPLLIAHGLFGSARNFNSLGRKLNAGRRVIMVDMPNHGDSPWTDTASYPAMADALADAIERLCDGRAVVLGHSMGGKTTMALALARPDLLAGIIVADIAPVAYSHSHLDLIQGMRAIDLSQVTRRSEVEPMLAQITDDAGLRAFLLTNLVIEGGQARWRLNLATLGEGVDDLIGWPDLPGSFGGPALFLYGGNSTYMTGAHADACRALCPGAQFQEIPNAGHWLHAEQPAAFLAAVNGWLAGLT